MSSKSFSINIPLHRHHPYLLFGLFAFNSELGYSFFSFFNVLDKPILGQATSKNKTQIKTTLNSLVLLKFQQ